MGRVLAIVNQKGGVGKTTTSVNLAASLAHLNRRVLLVDLDAQGNATMGCGVNKQLLDASLNELLLDKATAASVLQSTQAGFDLLPSNRNLTEAEVLLLNMTRKEYRLRQALSTLKDSYDFVLIDCPPSLNMLTINALVAADGVVIPMQCEYYALEGLTGLLETVQQLCETINPRLAVTGIIRTMYDPRNCLTADVSEQLKRYFGGALYETTIPRNIRLAEAPSHGLPALLYDKRSTGAQAYLKLAKEMTEKEAGFTPAHATETEATEAVAEPETV